MTRKPKESKIFDLKPQLTLAMKLAATFAITYYGLLFLFETVMLVKYHYSIDSYYLGNGEVLENRSKDFVFLVIEFVLTGLLVFSLIQIFRKKVNGKAFFVGFFWTAVLDVFLEESVALAWEGVFIQSNATTNTASAVMKLCLPQKSILPNP